MDDTPANKPPGENFNRIDLSALEAFQFGTQWTDAGDARRAEAGSGKPEHAHSPAGDSGPARRDRRPPRPAPSRSSGSETAEPPGQRFFPPAQRGPFRDSGPGRFPERGAPRGERFDRAPGQQMERGDFRERGPRRPMGPPRPYVSPIFELTFYPDDHGFTALVKAMRASCRTYELFEIARLILGKPERCVVVFRRRPDDAGQSGLLYIAVPDGLPFATEEEAINHALEHSLDQFFTTETVEVEPPKGNFQFVNRCPITKDLLGPPNYHRYGQIVQHHYIARGIRMPFEKYKAAIEVVRDPGAVSQWLETMKKAARYTYRGEIEGEQKVYDNVEDARSFLLRACRDRIVRAAETARLPAKAVEAALDTEAARAMHGALDTQRRFPLDTANALRGRLRRENFHIFKRGSKGVTFVCAVRRKFRQPGQTFSDSINRLIAFLDQNPMVPFAELPAKMLGFTPPPPAPPPQPAAAAPAPAATVSEAPTAETGGGTPPAEPAPVAPQPATQPALTPEQRTAFSTLMLDLRWLVSEGYVAEYSDGRLFAHPELPKEQHEAAERNPDMAGVGPPESAVSAAVEETAADVASEAPIVEPPAEDVAPPAAAELSDAPPPAQESVSSPPVEEQAPPAESAEPSEEPASSASPAEEVDPLNVPPAGSPSNP